MEIMEQVVDIISSLTFRARICKAQGINRQFSGSVMQRLDEQCSKEGFSVQIKLISQILDEAYNLAIETNNKQLMSEVEQNRKNIITIDE